MRAVKVFFMIALVFFMSILSADESFYMPSWSVYDEGLSFWGLTTNDGLGFDAGTDWDDGRTFGVAVGASVENWFLGLEAYGLTDRNNLPETGVRTDELDIFGGYAFYFPAMNWMAQSVLTAGVNIKIFGDFNGSEIQDIYHGSFAEARPLPSVYTAPAFHVYPMVTGESLLFPGINLRLRGMSGVDVMGVVSETGPDWFASVGVSQIIGADQVQLEYGLRWNWNRVSGEGAEAGIADLEKGLWIDGKARLGYFYLERNLDITTGNAAGSFGFMYGQDPVENQETEGSVCFTYAIPVITVGFTSIIRYQPVWLHENVDFLFSVGNVNELMDFLAEPMVRTSVITAGIEYFGLSLQKPYLINPFAFASAGTQYSRNVTNDAYRCENLNEYLVPVVHTGFGLRLCLSEILPFWKNVDWGIEFAGNARFDVILVDGNRHSPDAFFTYAFYARDFQE